jgi:hypothetical protein
MIGSYWKGLIGFFKGKGRIMCIIVIRSIDQGWWSEGIGVRVKRGGRRLGVQWGRGWTGGKSKYVAYPTV